MVPNIANTIYKQIFKLDEIIFNDIVNLTQSIGYKVYIQVYDIYSKITIDGLLAYPCKQL